MKHLKLMTLCIALLSANANARTPEETARMEKALSVISEYVQSEEFKKASPETKAAAKKFLAADREFKKQKRAMEESQKVAKTFKDRKRSKVLEIKPPKSNINRLMIDVVKKQVSGVMTDKDAVRWMNEHQEESKKMYEEELADKDSAIIPSLAKERAAMRSLAGKTL